jgi:O-antigen/teichoic acid export membrane protein
MSLRKLLTQSIAWRGFYFFSILLVNIFLSRYLQAAGTGNLYFITVIFSFMQVLLSLGGESGIIYFASGNIIERNKLITIAATWSFFGGLIMMGFVYLYFLCNASADKTLLNWYCAYGFLYVCGQALANYSTAIYYTKENYFLPNFLLSIVNIIYIFIIPGKNAVHDAFNTNMIVLLYFATFLGGGLLVFISYVLQYKNEGVIGFPERRHFMQLIRYSTTALGANAVFFLVYKIDYLFVNYSPVCTAGDLGNYIQVSKIGQMMLTVPQIIASVVFPRTASGTDEKNLSNAIITIARLFSQIFLLMFIFVAFIGKQFFIVVFGESFNKMQLPMLIIIPGIFSLSILALLSAYFAGKGKIRVNLYAAIIGLIVMVAGDIIFVPRYGIIAAAAVSTISYMANVIYSLWNFYKDYSIHWIEFFKWKKADYNWLLSFLKFNTTVP